MINQLETVETSPERSPLLLSLAAAAQVLGIGKWMLYELLHTGALPSVKIRSRRFIAKSDIDRYVSQLRAEAGERHGL